MPRNASRDRGRRGRRLLAGGADGLQVAATGGHRAEHGGFDRIDGTAATRSWPSWAAGVRSRCVKPAPAAVRRRTARSRPGRTGLGCSARHRALTEAEGCSTADSGPRSPEYHRRRHGRRRLGRRAGAATLSTRLGTVALQPRRLAAGPSDGETADRRRPSRARATNRCGQLPVRFAGCDLLPLRFNPTAPCGAHGHLSSSRRLFGRGA